MTSIVLGTEYLPVDSTITAIMARELLEGCMFCVSHMGAVLKNENFSREQKSKYLKILIPSVLCGVSIGLLVAIGIGISLVYAVGDSTNTQYGIEVGEAVSRMIGAFFVTDLMLKIPKWFQISNYKKPISDDDVEKGEDDFGRRWQIGFSLFWNVLRESLEGGSLTAVAVILSPQSQFALGNSVLVAFGATVALAIIFSLGAKYISARFFGIVASGLAQLLAMGLWTGMTRSFAEVSAMNNGGDPEAGGAQIIYNYDGTPLGDSLTILEFIGFSYALTSLTLTIWLLSFLILSFLQFWHNYLGRPFVPDSAKMRFAQFQRNLKSKCCCKSRSLAEKIEQTQPASEK